MSSALAQVTPQVELRARAQATLTQLVRAPKKELSSALACAASALFEDVRSDTSARQVLLAVRSFTAELVQLAVCVPLPQRHRPGAGVELAEIPPGRYLTATSELGPRARALASVLPVMRDWLGEHRECVTGPLFVELVERSLIVRQRIGGGDSRETLQQLPEDALRVLADSLQLRSAQG